MMAWLADFHDMGAARARAQKAMALPVGLASPLWLAFGAATTAGVAWWWMNRWTKAANLEALMGTPAAKSPTARTVIELIAVEVEPAAPAPEPVIEAAPPPVEAAAPPPEPVATPVVKAAVKVKPKAEPAPKPAPVLEPDDLTRMVGIGPKLAVALAEKGVTRFEHLAAWTARDLAKFDAALSLKGRAVRDAWVAQAQRLAKEHTTH